MRRRIILIALIVPIVASVNLSAQNLTTLHNFAGQPSDGRDPYAGLVQGSDGNFYGTTASGGANNKGTVFRMAPGGTVTVLHSFSGSDGQDPTAGLIQASDGNFYGTTSIGGNGPGGTVFRITPGGTLTTLVTFDGQGGPEFPYSGLIQGSDGNFYGTTPQGGTHFGNGTVYRITANGVVTTLYSFACTSGCNPYGGLVEGSDGNFYGTTRDGGNGFNYGTVFQITPGGAFTVLHTFDGTDGGDSYSSMVLGTDGNFYGTTTIAGSHGGGTVFKITPGGTLTTLYNFCTLSGCADGSSAYGGLVLANDGNFYGTTEHGGANNVGSLFQVKPSGMLTTLHSFNGGDGAVPQDKLVQANDGNFYGTTSTGGTSGDGTVFKLQLTYYTLSVAKNGSGTVTSSDNDINCGDVCSSEYFGGTQVTLTATPSSGWVFGNWSGCDNVNGNVCTVTMNNNRTATATFTATYPLTVSKVGNGTVTSGDGHINCGSTCSYTYLSGTVVTLTATPDSGWAFTGWTGCDNVNGNVCTLTMNSVRNVTATFTQTYVLTISKTGNGTVKSNDGYINCGSTCSHTYVSGSVVTLTALPDQGWGFVGWSGCDQINSNGCLVVIKSNRTVTATFGLLYALSVSKTGNGNVSSTDGHIYCGSVCSYSYVNGTKITLSAVPSPGYTFTGWTGCDNMNGSYCSVTMAGAKTVTAAFTTAGVTLTSLTFKPTYVKGGQLSVGTLMLNAPAPPGGVTVALSSDHPTVVHPPSFVFIPGGKSTMGFAVNTFPVKSEITVTITATAGSSHVSGTLMVGTTSLPPSLK